MPLILSSSDFGHPASRAVILEHLLRPIGECRLLFIPNEKATSDKVKSGKYHARMAGYGFDPELVSVLDYAAPSLCRGLDIDALYIGGGNTFLTLARLRSCGFDRDVADYIRGGGVGRGVTYIGGSAGAHLVCGDISHVARYDEPPVGDVLCGLGLVDLTLICHFSPERQAHLDELVASGRAVTPLSDGESLILNDNDF